MSDSGKLVSPPSVFARLTRRIHSAKEALEAGGVDFPGAGSLLWVTQKFGVKGTLLIILLVGFPLGEYSLLRSAVYSAVPRTIGGFGLEFEAEEWDLSPLKLKATARNVRVRAPSEDTPVLTAGEIEFQGSLWTFMTGLPDMLTFHIFGGHQPFNEIIVRHGELHMERSLTGQLNWDRFLEAVPAERRQEAVEGVYSIHGVRFEDFRVTYVEHVPGGSGDGVIKTAQAQVKLDEISATLTDLVQPKVNGDRPTTFKVRGRSADGIFEIAGRAAFFPAEGKVAGDTMRPGLDSRAVLFEEDRRGYPFEMSVYLENVAAGAYGKMVPVTTIVPAEGLIGGSIRIHRVGSDAECEGDLTMKDVRFAPNPLVLTDPSHVEVVRKELVKLVAYTGPVGLCSGGMEAAPAPAGPRQPPPVTWAMTRLTQQATSGAPPGIRALVAYDQQTLRGEKPNLTVKELTNVLGEQAAEQVARSLGNKVGLDVPEGSGNALTKGVKGVGSGIKRLFGGK